LSTKEERKMQILKQATLGWLASSSSPADVGVPQYDPAKLSPGILHVGVGNFFRAHLASYLDELFSEDQESNAAWGIVGAGVTNGSYSKRKETLESQDMLYSLVERDGAGSKARVVGSLIDLLPFDSKFKPIQEKMQDPEIKIVSTCITEGGYFLEPSSGRLDVDHPSIQHDLANPDEPETVIGLIVQALKRRRDADITPFTVLCCDNIPHNGDATKTVVCGLAKLQDEELGKWMEKNVCFPNSMVDRITPKTGEKEIAFLKEKYGYEDADPVFCEPFTQWVVEDNFVNGDRPPLEKVGVQFVEDVTPYELAKLRVLNGGHASLCYPAALLGIQYVHEAMEHPVIGPFLDTLERTDIVPGVAPLPDITAAEYWGTIQTRFENPTINDRIDRNCENGSDRQPKFIIPAIGAAIEGNIPLEGLALVCAMWSRYCQGTDETGAKVPPSDTEWEKLNSAAEKTKTDPQAWLGLTEIYGSAGKDKRFSEAFAAAVSKVNEDGVEAAMKAYTAKNGAIDDSDKENDPTLAMA
jgi:mannitol 2-dehydrogenase